MWYRISLHAKALKPLSLLHPSSHSGVYAEALLKVLFLEWLVCDECKEQG